MKCAELRKIFAPYIIAYLSHWMVEFYFHKNVILDKGDIFKLLFQLFNEKCTLSNHPCEKGIAAFLNLITSCTTFCSKN